jgi:hypothetical protein
MLHDNDDDTLVGSSASELYKCKLLNNLVLAALPCTYYLVASHVRQHGARGRVLLLIDASEMLTILLALQRIQRKQPIDYQVCRHSGNHNQLNTK